MIKLDRVSVEYAPGMRALNSVSVSIGTGEFIFVIGATGAGKSTFLKLLIGETKPASGSLLVNGQDITHLKRKHIPELRRGIGVVFQDFQLLPDRSVFENVAFALHVTGASRRKILPRTTSVLEQVGLLERKHALPSELSGGEQQRVCIARALVSDPTLIIADEPTGNMDPDTSDEIMGLFEKINRKGTTLLIATHDKSIVDRMKRRVLTFEGGQLVRDAVSSGYDEPASASLSLDLPLNGPIHRGTHVR